ncbi:MAG TPA: Xaa-Pro peptidase family protein [Solirubrobacteraceae bacterium]|nr:Xaa-Pro peptidase family protein [Solirubrobacteraceae bacterium]
MTGSRSDRVAAWLSERGLDALLVTNLVNVRYLTGFTGSNALALIGAGQDGRRRFVTDPRYVTQAAAQVDPSFRRVTATTDLLETLAPELVDVSGPDGGLRLGFDDAHLTVKAHARLRSLTPDSIELAPAAGLVERLRAIKEPAEIERIRAAADLVDAVLGWLAESRVVGRTERELAMDIEQEMRRRGARGPSFPSIVAGGEHSALPHAEPRDVAIEPATLLTVDLGAELDGYCSDCTRTFATGELGAGEREIYELVSRAQVEALQALRPGPTGREIDAIARDRITEAGHGEHFGHGLGHGVGLEIHEGPRLARITGTSPLAAGNVVTVEPGVYVPGRFGVRIEDLVAITADGHEVLSQFPKELITLG